MYKATRNGVFKYEGKVGTFSLVAGEEAPELNAPTLEKMLNAGAIEKISGKSGAAENKAEPAPEEKKPAKRKSAKKKKSDEE